MISIDLSEKELEAIIAGLQERETRMYSNAVQYRDYGNKVAEMDCIEEMHIAQHLRERLESLTR
jgi:hypothetical protein